MQPEISIVEYVAALANQGFSPQDFGLNTWEQAVRALRSFVRTQRIDPRAQTLVQNFQDFLAARRTTVEAARTTSTPALVETGTLYVPTERGTRLLNMATTRPDIIADFNIRQNDFSALLQIAENPGMSEQDIEVDNPRGALIALRQRGLIEPV